MCTGVMATGAMGMCTGVMGMCNGVMGMCMVCILAVAHDTGH